jgi:hypothetical protein
MVKVELNDPVPSPQPKKLKAVKFEQHEDMSSLQTGQANLEEGVQVAVIDHVPLRTLIEPNIFATFIDPCRNQF